MSFADFLFSKQSISKMEVNPSTSSTPGIPIPSATASKEEREFQLTFFKKKRASNKQQFTRIANQLEEALDNSIEVQELHLLQKNLKEKFEAIQRDQDLVLINTEDDGEIGYLDDLTDRFDNLTLQVRKLSIPAPKHATRRDSVRPKEGRVSERPKKTTEKPDSTDDEASPGHSESDSSSEDEENDVRSQKGDEMTKEEKQFFALLAMNYDVRKDVPKFDGDFAKYPSFRQAWSTADKKFSKMGKTPAEKLLELKKVLGGKALGYISPLNDARDKNYQGALEMLDNYYMDKHLTGKDAIDRLLNLPRMGSGTDSMEETFFALSNIRQNLEGLELTSKQAKTLLFTSIAETKLNTFVTKSWAKKCEAKQSKSHPLGHRAKISDFFDVLEREIKLSRTMSSSRREDKKEDRKKEEKKRDDRGSDKKSLPSSFGASKKTQKSEFPKYECHYCGKTGHTFNKCHLMTSASVSERWEVVKKKKLCSLCLCSESLHKTFDCTNKPCDINGCGRRHARLLHSDKRPTSHATQKTDSPKPVTSASTEKQNTLASCSASNSEGGCTDQVAILQSCLAWAVSPGGEKYKVRVFLDSGSEISLIRRDTADIMGLDGNPVTLQMNVAGGGITTPSKERQVTFRLESSDGRYTSPVIQATTTKEINSGLRAVPVDLSKFNHLKQLQFTESFPRTEAEVDVMVGLPYYTQLLSGTPIRGLPHEPMALPTKLGYVLTGSFTQSQQN